VANLTLKKLPANSEQGLAWDNVIYGARSLGYVSALHQSLESSPNKQHITYYLPLSALTPKRERELALDRPLAEWRELIVSDLARAHPDIVELITEIDLWIWGHAMVRPIPGFIWGENRGQLADRFGRVHFAHSDMSGISIFEEAQYQGVVAADQVLRELAV
jgi:hypothetical protein